MINSKFINLIHKSLVVVFILLISAFNANAQNVTATATLDSTIIAIGGQVDLKLQLSQPNNIDLSFPIITDTITKNIEIVRFGQLDTLNTENGRLLIEQSYRITSFDSGLHYIPPIVFEEAGKKLNKTIQTDAMALMVVNPFEEVDPQKGIVDIKPPVDTPFHISELYKYLPWVLGTLLLAALITFIILKYFGRDVSVKLFTKEEPVIPPHIRALDELERLKKEKLWQHHRIKEYYSGLTDTLRHYIEDRFHIRAMEQTTDEIMDSFKGVDVSGLKSIENLKQILLTADLVKFAKHEPLPDENDMSMINAYFFVNQTKEEEMKSLEEEKAEMLKKSEDEAIEVN